ncbi:hypothetical protein ACJJTC_018252 [Scirpophaga incertulas]
MRAECKRHTRIDAAAATFAATRVAREVTECNTSLTFSCSEQGSGQGSGQDEYDNISKDKVTQNDTTQTTADYDEEESITSNPPQKKKTKKIHMDHIISEADKKIDDSFATLSNVLQQKKVEADECDLYASLLAKKLRKYPERMRNSIMYKIDGLLLDNPYPDERPSSSSTFYSEPYQYTPAPSRQYTLTPSPQYAPTPSPQYAPTASPQYAPNPSPQYVPNQNTTVTSEPPIYIRIPEENIRVQEDLGNQVHILSEEVIVPAKMSNINAYNDS